MEFFYLSTDPSRSKTAQELAQLQRQHEVKKQDLKPDDRQNYIESHEDILHRILFIYAKLNPGIKYVQGMNEVLAVLYYCFLTMDPNRIVPLKFFESDLFFAFTKFMMELKDGFLRELDNEKSGIKGRMKTYAEILKVVEPHAHHTIEQN
jgi:TBC1 domain family member 13